MVEHVIREASAMRTEARRLKQENQRLEQIIQQNQRSASEESLRLETRIEVLEQSNALLKEIWRKECSEANTAQYATSLKSQGTTFSKQGAASLGNIHNAHPSNARIQKVSETPQAILKTLKVMLRDLSLKPEVAICTCHPEVV